MKKSLIAIAVLSMGSAQAVAQSMNSISIWRGVEQGMRLPYPPEVERRAQRAAWGRTKKIGKRK